MLKFFSAHKKKVSVLTLLIILTALIGLNLFGFKDFLYKKHPNLLILKEFKDNKYLSQHIKNDYNTVFLPDTQFEKLKLTKNKIIFNSEYYVRNLTGNSGIASPSYGSFFIETYQDEILLIDYLGTVYKINQKDVDELNPKKNKSNNNKK